MKKDIHPTVMESKVVCGSCGNTFVTLGTQKLIETELCAKCHPFFTGKQVLIDTAGQVDRFRRKVEVASTHQAKAPKKVKVKATDVKEEKKVETNEELLTRIKKQLEEDARKKLAKKTAVKSATSEEAQA